jgi:gamma-glutamyltranspeptidase / glutathione hydrolase
MSQRSVWLPDRSEIAVAGGMVVAKHPLAAAAGVAVLQAGGNAADAAVATGFVLTVVKVMWTSLGGVGFLLAHDAARGEQWCMDGAPRAPLACHAESYEVLGPAAEGIALYRVRGDENDAGHRAAAVPGVVAMLCAAHTRLGRLPLAQLLEPAIRLAEDGFLPDWNTTLWIAGGMAKLQRNAAAAATFLPDGRPASWLGDQPLRQPDLARTLRAIAADGADGFYRGETARLIAEDMRAHGGWIAEDDLANYPRLVEPPRRVRYRDLEVCLPPMACGATTAAETLRILERFDIAAAGHNTVDGLHLFIEASHRAFADRFHYLADPEFVDVPLRGLLSDGHAAELAALIDHERSTTTVAEGGPEPWVRFSSKQPAGDPWRFEDRARVGSLAGGALDSADSTTHFAVVDAERNAVTCTLTTAGLFGAGVLTPGAGICWNNGMTWFNPLPGTANSIAPGKRALTNMTPLLVLRDGAPLLALGAPGGRRIINAITQIVLNTADHGLGMQPAISAPRIDASGNVTAADERLDPAILRGLEQRGHRIVVRADGPGAAPYSRPLGIMLDPRDGLLHSGGTPFHIAEAHGY